MSKNQQMAQKSNETSKLNANRIKMRKANPEAKDAKESAFWIKKLLEEKEIAEQKILYTMKPKDFVSKTRDEERVELIVYLRNLPGKFRHFTTADRLYENDRRKVENAKASEFLGHPAMNSARVFDNGIMAAEFLLQADPAELGCKNLFAGIELRKNIREDLYAQIEDLKNVRQDVLDDRYEASKNYVQCVELGGGNDLDTYNQIIANDKESFAVLTMKIRKIQKNIKLMKAEIKVLNRALKEIRQIANPAQAALIDARAKVAARKCKCKEDKTFGRPVMEADKPMLKGYKLMHFKTKATLAQFMSYVDAINDAGMKAAETMQSESATDDERAAAVKQLKDAFQKGLTAIKVAKNKGEKIRLNAEFARIHNARQSQLTDTIGVIYGKTTDMVISISHDVANLFNWGVKKYLDEDTANVNELFQDFMEAVLSIATTNGLDVAMLPSSDGKRRTVGYKFWNANNAQLKLGKFNALSDEAYERAAEAGRAGMSEEEFEELWCNGSDLLKWWSYATTPGCPLEYNGEPLTVNDVLVVPSINSIRVFRNVLKYNEDGDCELLDKSFIERTLFDGELLFLVPIKSQQLRGGFAFKGFATCVAYEDGSTMIDEIARRENLQIPDKIKDIDGNMQDWRKFKVICTEDCFKWAGWKFGTEKRKFLYADYCERMNKLAEKFPAANKLYTARIADATEESKRRLTRQSIQQFIFASHAQIERLAAKSLGKLNKWSTHDGVIRVLAGLDKPEDERTAFEHLVEVCPELLDHPYMKRAVEDMYNRAVAEAAVRPEVNGIYPYIAEDPVAMIKIIFWGFNPNKMGIGYLKGDEVNAPETKDDIKMYVVRYPNNYLCGRIRKNKNDDIYRCVGNVLILSIDGGLLTIADGDTDGDEMCVIRDEVVVEMMTETMAKIHPPIISFPHGHMEKNIVHGKETRAAMLAKAMVIANMYGPEVGKNSNLATKFMCKAALAYELYMKTHDSKQEWIFKKNLSNAIVAHIAAIIAIDLAKTGKMPKWLEGNLNAISKFAGKKMPWNQRFCKDSKATPWFDKGWNENTLPESNTVVDRFARFVINESKAESYEAPTGDGFDIHDLLGSKEGLDTRGSSGLLDVKALRALDARNYREQNSENDDEYKVVAKLKDGLAKSEVTPKDKVSPAEMIRFLWRNQASLVYVLQKEGSDRLDNASMQNSYYEFCHDLLCDFGGYRGNDTFMKRSKESRQKSNLYKFVEMAFSSNNGIGKNIAMTLDENGNEVMSEEAISKKASFAMFVIKVFAYDLYVHACEQKGIKNIWIKPVFDENTDEADAAESCVDESAGYGMEECAA